MVPNERPYYSDKNYNYDSNLLSVDITLSDEIIMHDRCVYTLMNLFGDIGGMKGVIIALLGLLVNPITEHSFFLKVLELLFMAQTTDKSLFNHKNLNKKNKDETKYSNFYPININNKLNIRLFLQKTLPYFCIKRNS